MGVIIMNIPYLKQLAVGANVPIVFCKKDNIDKVKKVFPAFFHQVNQIIWQLLDEEDNVLYEHNWKDKDDSILNWTISPSLAINTQGLMSS